MIHRCQTSSRPTEFAASQANRWPASLILAFSASPCATATPGGYCVLDSVFDRPGHVLVLLKAEAFFPTARLSNRPPRFIRVHARDLATDPSCYDLEHLPPSRCRTLRGRAYSLRELSHPKRPRTQPEPSCAKPEPVDPSRSRSSGHSSQVSPEPRLFKDVPQLLHTFSFLVPRFHK